MTTITEIAPDVYRICTYIPEIDLQFNQFLIKDERRLQELSILQPRTCATMHGSAIVGDGARALLDLGVIMKEVLSNP